MSGNTAMQMSSQYSALGMKIGQASPYTALGFLPLAPSFRDHSLQQAQANGVITPALGSKVSFNLQKNSTIIGKCYLSVTLSAGTTLSTGANGEPAAQAFDPDVAIGAANVPVAEYNKHVGDILLDRNEFIYGSTNVQTWDGAFQAMLRRVSKHDNHIEHTNTQTLGGLNPGGDPESGSERVLVDAFYRGVTLDIPLEELFFVHRTDEHWLPEAYALEAQIQSRLATLGQIVSTLDRSAAPIVAAPAITNIQLRFVEHTVSAVEKSNLLQMYKTPEGVLTHFFDLEHQKNLRIDGVQARAPGAALATRPILTRTFNLSNLRMDCAELVFHCVRVRNDAAAADFPTENGVVTSTGFGGNPLECDNQTASILHSANGTATPSAGFAAQVDIESIDILANGKRLFSQSHSGDWNRAHVRKCYHPDSQIAGCVFIVSFAQHPDDRKNCTNSVNPSVLGTMQLELGVRDPGPLISYEVTVYSRADNFVQARGGSLGKILA